MSLLLFPGLGGARGYPAGNSPGVLVLWPSSVLPSWEMPPPFFFCSFRSYSRTPWWRPARDGGWSPELPAGKHAQGGSPGNRQGPGREAQDRAKAPGRGPSLSLSGGGPARMDPPRRGLPESGSLHAVQPRTPAECGSRTRSAGATQPHALTGPRPGHSLEAAPCGGPLSDPSGYQGLQPQPLPGAASQSTPWGGSPPG